MTAVLSLGVLGGICILGGAEAKDRPAASSINTGMTEERDGLIGKIGPQLDRVSRPWFQLSRDQEPDPSEGLGCHHLPERLLLKLQAVTGLEIVYKQQIDDTYQSWITHPYN